ncbi:MAG: hypothetical protein FWD13_07085, partial [Treponema sp.]|nr:hypothetical protein [Treponema sp.]
MKKLAIFLLLVTLITGNIFAQQHTARELAEQSRQVLENAHALFIDNKFIEAIAEYENAIGLGGLSQYQTQMAQTLLKEAQDVLAKIESFKRP